MTDDWDVLVPCIGGYLFQLQLPCDDDVLDSFEVVRGSREADHDSDHNVKKPHIFLLEVRCVIGSVVSCDLRVRVDGPVFRIRPDIIAIGL